MANTNGFRPGSELSHWGKHWQKFAVPVDVATYASMADDFFGARPPGIAEGQRRGNGDIIRFDPVTEHFGVVDNHGFIKTFYPAETSEHDEATNAEYFMAEITK
jgi:pyocin large subunit-like protein